MFYPRIGYGIHTPSMNEIIPAFFYGGLKSDSWNPTAHLCFNFASNSFCLSVSPFFPSLATDDAWGTGSDSCWQDAGDFELVKNHPNTDSMDIIEVVSPSRWAVEGGCASMHIGLADFEELGSEFNVGWDTEPNCAKELEAPVACICAVFPADVVDWIAGMNVEPMFAALLIQSGIWTPSKAKQKASVKWLQFRVVSSYSPTPKPPVVRSWVSAALISLKGPVWIPIHICSRKWPNSGCRGGVLKIPCAEKEYSLPWISTPVWNRPSPIPLRNSFELCKSYTLRIISREAILVESDTLRKENAMSKHNFSACLNCQFSRLAGLTATTFMDFLNNNLLHSTICPFILSYILQNRMPKFSIAKVELIYLYKKCNYASLRFLLRPTPLRSP